jgi:hypothetical protein
MSCGDHTWKSRSSEQYQKPIEKPVSSTDRAEDHNMQKVLCWSWLVVLLIGCGGVQYEASSVKQSAAQVVADDAGAMDPEKAGEAQRPDEITERKIIYEGRVSLVVEEFDAMESAIPELVKQFEGYLKEANVNRMEGRWRSGRWVARIPSARFEEFLAEVSQLGIAELQEQTAQDVTMEYLDLEARIKTKKELEQRILKLLEDREGKLSDVVEAERELSRVRSEIESMEGQLRYLQNRTAFSTVTIDVREERDYIPEASADFASRASKAWQESLRALKLSGQNVAIAVVAFVPWIIPLSVVAAVMVFTAKRLRRSFARK